MRLSVLRLGCSVLALSSSLLTACGTTTTNYNGGTDNPQLPGSQPTIGSMQQGDGTYYGATG